MLTQMQTQMQGKKCEQAQHKGERKEPAPDLHLLLHVFASCEHC